MIVSSPKYNVQETPLSLYETRMTVTIRKFQKEDIGSYRCIAKNSLGEVDSSIRLYGLYSVTIFYNTLSSLCDNFIGFSLFLSLSLSCARSHPISFHPLNNISDAQKYLIQKLVPVTITIITRTQPNTMPIRMIYTNHISSSINHIDRQK